MMCAIVSYCCKASFFNKLALCVHLKISVAIAASLQKRTSPLLQVIKMGTVALIVYYVALLFLLCSLYLSLLIIVNHRAIHVPYKFH
ncbi:hypothetical protein XELAEV_18035178mg [Xenopus laevis]|uniref:Uncharacterized protein n=1 Tax=Xenopus laevis TaxID=8355 RepID=A0A974CFS1_XENLA|nr:hypothetical protein XELAEV_18035178mg [Xenopus laevis]